MTPTLTKCDLFAKGDGDDGATLMLVGPNKNGGHFVIPNPQEHHF